MQYQLAHYMETIDQMAHKPIARAKVKQFGLDEQIERARLAAQRLDAGYFFKDEELDDERLTQPPLRLDNKRDEWL